MDEVARLIALVEMLRTDLQHLTAGVIELEAENRKLKAQLGSDANNFSKPPSSNLPWVKPAPKKMPSGKKAGRQTGHAGKARTQAPPECVDHTLAVRPTTCPKGSAVISGFAKSQPGWRHQVVEVPPIQIVITNYAMES